jgi:GT2 family glycosyltransferase
MLKELAVLVTCHNRQIKTLQCLRSLHSAILPDTIKFTVFLVDDGCTDSTVVSINDIYPDVFIIKGNGSLYWAGGMRLAWRTALSKKKFNSFLLLNDDVVLKDDFFLLLLECHDFAIKKYGVGGVYTAATFDFKKNKTSYGGQKIIKNSWRVLSQTVEPNGQPQLVDMVNANILWVESNVVDKISILSDIFTHGIADYDYGLRANKAKLPVLLTSNYGGYCIDDHKSNYSSQGLSLRDRVKYLKSPTGLAYDDYIAYIFLHFPLSLPYSFLILWLKTIFPIFWKVFRK